VTAELILILWTVGVILVALEVSSGIPSGFAFRVFRTDRLQELEQGNIQLLEATQALQKRIEVLEGLVNRDPPFFP